MDTTLTLPHHVAIIPDGNRRWAKQNHLPAMEGHRKGTQVSFEVVRALHDMGIPTVTFWGFSTENWSRSKDEISKLIMLGKWFFGDITKDAVANKVKVRHLGRKDRLPKEILKLIKELEEKTAHFTDKYLNLAIDYGGRDEILRGMARMKEQKIDPETVTEENFNAFLDTHDQPYPNPDLVIRTSGEHRTSGYLIWQAAYAEYFFLDKYFPDVTKADLETAIEDYSNRIRRFGA